MTQLIIQEKGFETISEGMGGERYPRFVPKECDVKQDVR